MNIKSFLFRIPRVCWLIGLVWLTSCLPVLAAEPTLSLWREGSDAKTTIVDFVADVVNPASPHYVVPKDRIAVFDNDGTLWVERPCLGQAAFILSRGPNPGFGDECLPSDRPMPNLAELALDDIYRHPDTTIEDYKTQAHDFVNTEIQPYFGHHFVDLAYAPMVQLLDYLRHYDFQVYICSGGGLDFIRSFAEQAYGIPPQNVIGSAFQTQFTRLEGGRPALIRLPIPAWPFTNYEGKAEGIAHFLGKKPIMVVGNAEGDIAMMQYADGDRDSDREQGLGRRLMIFVDHDDGDREYAYTAQGALDAAHVNGWSVVSMKDDFLKIFSWEGD
jgi:hypothetical protein